MKANHKLMTLNKFWVEENTEPIDWQRQIYPARVNTFVNHIKNGTLRPNSQITLWEDGKSKFKILDGQHKLEAVKITDTAHVFDVRILSDLTKEEAMKEYEILADVKHHRSIDIIKEYVFGRRLEWLCAFLDEKRFPINVRLTGGVNAMRLDNFLVVLYNGFRKTLTRTSLSRNKLRVFIESLDAEKYATMKEFCSLYKKCFGDPSNESWIYKNVVMMSLMRIWLANKQNYKEKDFIEVFKKIEQNAGIRQDSYIASTGLTAQMIKKMYRVINKGRSANKFEIFWEEDMLLDESKED